VATYKQAAAGLGKPGAARAAGNACGRNKNAQFAQIHTDNNHSPEETSPKKDIPQLWELLKAMEKEWRYSEGL
jgi:alkylated DNA nucleotide flippase Atl1